jgi:diamine N-acetyltransferase
MVGFVMYEDDEEQERWWISTVMIAADYQGRGYAKAAIRKLIPILKQRDCRQISVGYDTDNVAARGLYAGLRFEEVGLG